MGSLSHISLFSGAMGLDLGLEQAGFETRVLVEIDSAARRTIEINMARQGKKVTVFDDITRLEASQVIEAAGMQPACRLGAPCGMP